MGYNVPQKGAPVVLVCYDSSMNAWLLVPAIGLIGWMLGRPRVRPHPYPAPRNVGLDFAVGGNPTWPIRMSTHRRAGEVAYRTVDGKMIGNGARAIKASRGDRHHAGIDLYAFPDDLVVAPEDGTIVGEQSFYAGTRAVLIALDSGPVILLGETNPGGLREFDLTVGSRVRKGQPVTRVGQSSTGSHMLQVEMYEAGTTKNQRWPRGSAPPRDLLDPTDYLLRAKYNSAAVLA